MVIEPSRYLDPLGIVEHPQALVELLPSSKELELNSHDLPWLFHIIAYAAAAMHKKQRASGHGT